jgi:hypothetical protein
MKISIKRARELGKTHKIDYNITPFSEFFYGLQVETEHSDILAGDYDILTRIVKAHLRENPRYYLLLKKAGL